MESTQIITRQGRIQSHVANTWLLANALHIAFLLILLLSHTTDIRLQSSDWTLVLLVAIIVFAASLPALVLGYFCLDIIANGPYPFRFLFTVWAIVCPVLVLIEGMVGMLIFQTSGLGSLLICTPGMLAALLAVIFRYSQFKSLITQHTIN